MLIGTCCDASNCDDVLHHIAIYEYYCCSTSYVKTATDSCLAVHKVALVMNMMCPTSLNNVRDNHCDARAAFRTG
jgi:hypothetical protein